MGRRSSLFAAPRKPPTWLIRLVSATPGCAATARTDESLSPPASYRQRHDMRTQPEGWPAMPGSDPVAQTLDVPGARLYYQRQGVGPLLLMIGSPMDSAGFAGLARALADRYAVVTYDPRGIGNSNREDATQDVTPEQQADDVHRLLSVLGGEPAHVFGSSGGAGVGVALGTAHPGQVRTLVAHEPPVVELLPDSAQVRAQIEDIYDTYRADGAEKAMRKFMAHTGLGDAPGQEADAARWEPSPEEMARMR